MPDSPEGLIDDGLYLPEIGAHSLEKIRRHNYYAALFSKAMAGKWKHRVYIGLYAGAGRATVKRTGELVETSAIAVLRLDPPFTKYIFVDSDRRCIEALDSRIAALDRELDVELIQRPVNDAVPEILAAVPRFDPSAGEGLLCLCFVDPFRLDLDFDVIGQLSRFKIDFLVMLPLGFDLRRNLRRYLEDEEDERVGRLINDPDWRAEWRRLHKADRYLLPFVLQKFDQAMGTLGFRPREMKDTVSVKVTGMGVYLYSLALYTRHPLGEQFWKTTIAGTSPQIDMGI